MSDGDFSFEGYAYVRPLGRGICLVDYDGNFHGPQLEDEMAEGYYRIVIDMERIDDQDNWLAAPPTASTRRHDAISKCWCGDFHTPAEVDALAASTRLAGKD